MQSFIARQPIFDIKQNVYAYELLFRSGLENYFHHADPDEATSRVISDALMLFGQDHITEGKRAFINFTRELLLNDFAAMLPPEWVVIEILETVEPDPEVVAACRRLKKMGYTLALDDFVYEPKFQPLVDLADVIKIDFMAVDQKERRAMVDRFRPLGLELLAEKVETIEEFQEAVDLGYRYLQGYFFAKPHIVSGRDMPRFKAAYLRLLQEIHRPGLSFDDLAGIIQSDVSLSYKLLRYINSAFFGLPSQIHSIKQALVLLGQDNVKKWASLLALAGMGEDKPDELVVSSLIRARFCESLADRLGLADRASDLFLLGLFSQMDAFMDRPLGEVVAGIPLPEDVKTALTTCQGGLASLPKLIGAYERGDWDALSGFIREAKLPEDLIPGIYVESIGWSNQALAV